VVGGDVLQVGDIIFVTPADKGCQALPVKGKRGLCEAPGLGVQHEDVVCVGDGNGLWL
jgi:hypothetical protein